MPPRRRAGECRLSIRRIRVHIEQVLEVAPCNHLEHGHHSRQRSAAASDAASQPAVAYPAESLEVADSFLAVDADAHIGLQV